MNRRLQIANFAGVIALAVLCVVQWTRDRQSNLEVIRLENVRQSQAKELADQTNSIQGLTRDLAAFKERLGEAGSDLAASRKEISLLQTERDDLSAETLGLKESLTAWTNAVAERDERIKEANDRILDLGGRLDDAIQKFNALATNYNAVVVRLNAQTEAAAAAAAAK